MDELGWTRATLRDRNWYAVVGLWSGLAAWLIVCGTVVWGRVTSGDPPEAIAWTIFAFAVAALALSVCGVAAIRTRGEPIVAVVALVLVLALSSVVSPLLFLGGFGGFD